MKERSNDLEVAHPQNGSSSGLIPSRIGTWKCWLKGSLGSQGPEEFRVNK